MVVAKRKTAAAVVKNCILSFVSRVGDLAWWFVFEFG
jgi:hypothetical protein